MDPFRYFRVEARELIERLGQGVLELERGAPAAEVVARLLRVAHTLKGAARVVKLPLIADRAHAIEDALAPFREPGAVVPRAAIDAVLRATDEVRAQLETLDPPQPASAPAAAARAPVAPKAEAAEMDELLDGIAESQSRAGSLRVPMAAAEKIGASLRALGEQIPQSIADEISALQRGLRHASEGLERELRQLRDTAEHMRLLPAESIFDALERTARDVAQAQAKRVGVSRAGGAIRLEARVLGAVQEAMIQIVRNAVAHGLELPALRRAAGKPIEGQVAIEVIRRHQTVAFVCRDDGGGVDLVAVKRALAQKGVTGLDKPDQIVQALVKGGVSTSRTITEVSGRGVGLDVAREVASRLGGTLDVATEQGRGTTVTLAVPLTLASLEALLVEVRETTLAIPLEAVAKSVRVEADRVARGPDGDTVIEAGLSMSYATLARLWFGARDDGAVARASTAVIVEAGGARAMIGVDRIVGAARLVVRPLPELAPASPLVAGASIDGAGNPQIVLHAAALIAEAQRSVVRQADSRPAVKPILIIDDSLTTRMLEQSILESAGYTVELATSAEEGLEMAKKDRYALFLVDVEMPGIDGFTFVERTRADPDLRSTPAILVTSRNSPEDLARGKSAGASGYIVKSEFDQTSLLTRIRELVGASG